MLEKEYQVIWSVRHALVVEAKNEEEACAAAIISDEDDREYLGSVIVDVTEYYEGLEISPDMIVGV